MKYYIMNSQVNGTDYKSEHCDYLYVYVYEQKMQGYTECSFKKILRIFYSLEFKKIAILNIMKGTRNSYTKNECAFFKALLEYHK